MNSSPRGLSLVKVFLLGVFLAGAVYFVFFTETGQGFTPHQVKETFAEFHPLGARFFYVLAYAAGTVLLVPGTVLSFVGAFLFGLWEGTLYTWLGATIGATLSFFLARFLGRDFVEGLLGGRFQTFDQRLRDHGFSGLLVLRLVPLFPFTGINFASGLTAIRPWDYILATAIGILPGTFVYQFLFSRFGEGATLGDFFSWDVALALAGFIAFTVIGKWLSNKIR